MTPTDFHLLPPRELTPQPYSKERDGIDLVNPGDRELRQNFYEVSRHTEVNI